jgi:hypothetical protein
MKRDGVSFDGGEAETEPGVGRFRSEVGITGKKYQDLSLYRDPTLNADACFHLPDGY